MSTRDDVVPGKHVPTCDTQLGPDFEVEPGVVRMTIFACTGCLPRERVYGMCTACGSIEVPLRRATGTRDLSGIGESSVYPTGYGCDLCS